MTKQTTGTIHISITGTRIYPYKKHQCYFIENLTSVKEKGYGRNLRKPITGFLLPDKDGPSYRGTFVTHNFERNVLQNLFPDYLIKVDDPNDSRQLNHTLSLNADVNPREVQQQIIDQIIQKQESHQWFVYLSQGLGKTLLSVYLISFFNVKTLIMCYSTAVLKQWVKTFHERTDINMNSVLLIDDGKIFDKILRGSFPVWEYDIFMCTPKILTMYGKHHGMHVISMIFDKMGIGMKIFDEAHRNIKNIILINAYSSVDKTLYLSGDYAQSNPIKQNCYYRIFYKTPIVKPTEELMNTLKYTVAIAVSFRSHPTDDDLDGMYIRRGFSFYNYMKYQINKRKFYDALWFILDSINQVNEKKYRILVLLNIIEHVDIVMDEIEDHYPNQYIIGRYHSKVDDMEKEYARKNANLIVSTHQSFSTGLDWDRFKYVITCCVCTKIDDNQASGRSRPLQDGSDAFYFMMYDQDVPYAKKSIEFRMEYLQKTKIKDVRHIKL